MKLNVSPKELLSLYSFLRNNQAKILTLGDVHLDNLYGRINAYMISLVNKDSVSDDSKLFKRWEQTQSEKISDLESQLTDIKNQAKAVQQKSGEILTPDDLPDDE